MYWIKINKVYQKNFWNFYIVKTIFLFFSKQIIILSFDNILNWLSSKDKYLLYKKKALALIQ